MDYINKLYVLFKKEIKTNKNFEAFKGMKLNSFKEMCITQGKGFTDILVSQMSKESREVLEPLVKKEQEDERKKPARKTYKIEKVLRRADRIAAVAQAIGEAAVADTPAQVDNVWRIQDTKWVLAPIAAPVPTPPPAVPIDLDEDWI